MPLPLFNLSTKSFLGIGVPAGTLIKATTFFFRLISLFNRFNDSIKTSIPLFLNSYLPLVHTSKVSSSRFVPNNLFATLSIFALAFLRLAKKLFPLGTKSSSNPFFKTTSASLSSNSLHSLLVISLTVVKQSTW